MPPVSLMPPVDHCPSCEGRKAARDAFQIGEARARQAELQAADPAAEPATGAASPPADGAAPAVAGNDPKPAAAAVPSLLAPDLAVQASLAGSGLDAASGEAASLRLRGVQAYRGL